MFKSINHLTMQSAMKKESSVQDFILKHRIIEQILLSSAKSATAESRGGFGQIFHKSRFQGRGFLYVVGPQGQRRRRRCGGTPGRLRGQRKALALMQNILHHVVQVGNRRCQGLRMEMPSSARVEYSFVLY